MAALASPDVQSPSQIPDCSTAPSYLRQPVSPSSSSPANSHCYSIQHVLCVFSTLTSPHRLIEMAGICQIENTPPPRRELLAPHHASNYIRSNVTIRLQQSSARTSPRINDHYKKYAFGDEQILFLHIGLYPTRPVGQVHLQNKSLCSKSTITRVSQKHHSIVLLSPFTYLFSPLTSI